jgi:hypothetical protein
VVESKSDKKLHGIFPNKAEDKIRNFFEYSTQVQFKEIPNEDVDQDETLSEVIAVLETNDYNSNIENIVEEVYTAVNNVN